MGTDVFRDRYSQLFEDFGKLAHCYLALARGDKSREGVALDIIRNWEFDSHVESGEGHDA